MAEHAAHPSNCLPFSNLCDVLKPLLLSTGKRGKRALDELMNAPFQGALHHLAARRLKTPQGTLRISAKNINGLRRLDITLEINKAMGYVHGEVYKIDTLVPTAIAACAIGQPLATLCETPEGFPGAQRTVENIRKFTRSTRIKIAHSPATIAVDEIS